MVQDVQNNSGFIKQNPSVSQSDLFLESLPDTLSLGGDLSQSFSCADKLINLFAEQIFSQKELSIAYPCLECKGGLSLFFKYLTFCAQTETPGRAFEPMLVYPGTTEIREFYKLIKIRIGSLLDYLAKIRVAASRVAGGSPCVYPWEETLLRKIRLGKIDRGEELPLHDFFPAALLDGNSIPHIIGGRQGFGRGDETTPPLHFAVRIESIPKNGKYKMAILMHDSLTTYAERRRLQNNLKSLSADCIVHLFESPFSPNFKRLNKSGVKSWPIKPADFPADGKIFLEDKNILEILDMKPRVHSLPSVIRESSIKRMFKNFREIRKAAGSSNIAWNAYRQVYNLYRFVLTMPVPVKHYNEKAKMVGYSSFRERFLDIKEDVTELTPTEQSHFDDALECLSSIADSVEKDPSRSRAIISEAQRALEKRQRIGFVFTQSLFGSAAESFMAEELSLDPINFISEGIHILSIGDLKNIKSKDIFDVLVFPSYRGGNTLRWIMSGKAKEVVVIATSQERWAITQGIKAATEIQNSWTPNHGQSTLDLDDKVEEKLTKVLGISAPELPNIPLDDDMFVQGLFEHTPKMRTATLHEYDNTVCRLVTLLQHKAYLPASGVVTTLTTSGPKEKAVKDLKPDMTILFINQAQSKTIYDLMLDEIKRSLSFEPYVSVIQQWHRRLESWFAKSAFSYAEVHRALRLSGCTVVSATVRSWLRGSTMAPSEPANLKRIFDLIGIKDTNGMICDQVNAAAKKLRAVYKLYGRAVNSFLLKAAGDDRVEVDALLQKYNLDISAIRESVIKESIVSISDDQINIPSSVVGRLYAK